MTPEECYQTYLAYLKMKVDEADWHGVADAAMDLRELEAMHPELKLLAIGIKEETDGTQNVK